MREKLPLTQPERACFEARQKERDPEHERYLDRLERDRLSAIQRAEHERWARRHRSRKPKG